MDIKHQENSGSDDGFSTYIRNDEDEMEDEFDEPSDVELTTTSKENEEEQDKWVPDEQLRLLYVYFKDMAVEPLFTAKQEVEISAKIKKCEAKAKDIIKKLKKLKDMRSPLRKNSSEAKIIDKRFLSLDAFSRIYYEWAQKLKQKFVKANLRLVITISRRYMSRGLPLPDLIQEGNLGLMRAVERFDHTKGYKFSTYASWWIHQAILRALQGQTRTIKVPVYLLEQANRVYKTSAKLSKEIERKPTPKEIAEESGISVEVVKRILNSTNDAISLDTPVLDGEKTTLLDSVADKEAKIPDTIIAKMSLAEKLQEALTLLNPREEEIIRLRFGIGRQSTYTLDEIGKKFNLTRERIRQIEKAALGKLAGSNIKEELESFLIQ
ncbi:MAG: sigma-70 family RNA polymerase sigma factor [Thermodesulfobacteriota bacterium]